MGGPPGLIFFRESPNPGLPPLVPRFPNPSNPGLPPLVDFEILESPPLVHLDLIFILAAMLGNYLKKKKILFLGEREQNSDDYSCMLVVREEHH